MTKVMLVEDDKSLREIYGVRLLAEGYDIVSAGDGEEALAMAIKERPQLIISDVMMPKISGFDMLDILRSTTETRDIKVIMMTALSSEDQRSRGQALGADRYLVKSQVGIEDVVRVVHEVLEDQGQVPQPQQQAAAPAQPTAPPAAPQPAPAQAPQPAAAPQQPVQPAPAAPAPPPQPVPPQPAPVAPQAPPAATPTPPAPQPPVAQAAAPAPGLVFQSAAAPTGPQAAPQPAPAPQPPRPAQFSQAAPKTPATRNRVIQPLNDPSVAPVDINELLDKELAREAGLSLEERPNVSSIDQEKELIDTQIQSFQNAPVPPAPPVSSPQPPSDVPPVNIDQQGTFSIPQQPAAPQSPPQSQSDDEPPAAPQVQPPAPTA